MSPLVRFLYCPLTPFKTSNESEYNEIYFGAIFNNNLPSSHKQLKILTSIIGGYRLNMIIHEYGEIIIIITIFLFVKAFRGER